MADSIPRIAITPGEPAGCGPDLAIKLAQEKFPAELVFISNPELLQQRAELLGLSIDIVEFDANKLSQQHQPNVIHAQAVALKQKVIPGNLNRDNASFVLETLNQACDGCLNNTFAAMVTGPVQKSIINDAGISFSGHTEYLAERCNNSYPVMMLANDRCRVALVTTHLPLNQVSNYIDQATLKQTLLIVESDLRQRFGITKPKILVCGLNPHAGESGHLGTEEINVISPVIKELSDKMDIEGPLPADTVFTKQYLDTADIVVSMYHDQSLPALKALGFGETVNITLGLPIIRTSVDHGTALDLAGTPNANHNSFKAAVMAAINLANIQNKRS